MPRHSVAHAGPAELLARLFSRRILFVAGKGGTGKTTLSAALLLLAAKRGLRVLGIEAEGRGHLAAALGCEPVGFEPRIAQRNISLLALQPEAALREYLNVYFKVPKALSVTPLSRVFDFIATSVPGPKDLLFVGKVTFEERRRGADNTPAWDLIVVDCPPTGRILQQLMAAAEMRKLTRGGLITGQLDSINAVLADRERTALVLTAIPEEMAVLEAIELWDQARALNHVGIAGAFLNRMPVGIDREARALADQLCAAGHREAVSARLEGDSGRLCEAIDFGVHVHDTALPSAEQLAERLTVPVVEVPLQAARDGLGMSRAVAAVLETP